MPLCCFNFKSFSNKISRIFWFEQLYVWPLLATSEPAFLLGLRFPFTAKALSYNPTNELRIFSYYPLLHFWRNFDERMKFCQTATLWSSNCATSWNFKLRLSAKYYTNSHETNCSNSPIGTAFRRGIIHICKLFHCKAYFDKPQTATLNYIFRYGTAGA